MNYNILIVYKSKTGFTRQYAEMMGAELECTITELKNTSSEVMSKFDIIVFGGGF